MGPFAFPRNTSNLAWPDMHNSKLPQTKDFMLKTPKNFNKIVPMLSDDSSGHFISKGKGTKIAVPGCSLILNLVCSMVHLICRS